MGKYDGLTAKELKTRLLESDKQVSRLTKENGRMASLLEEVEPALGRANNQIEELRSTIDEMTIRQVELEQRLTTASDELKEAGFHAKQSAKLGSDLAYEHNRRISAENRAYDLEQRVLGLANTHLEVSAAREQLAELRLDRHGDIA